MIEMPVCVYKDTKFHLATSFDIFTAKDIFQKIMI